MCRPEDFIHPPFTIQIGSERTVFGYSLTRPAFDDVDRCRASVHYDPDGGVEHCGSPSVVVNLIEDTGHCWEHLTIKEVYPLHELSLLVGRYWNGAY